MKKRIYSTLLALALCLGLLPAGARAATALDDPSQSADPVPSIQISERFDDGTERIYQERYEAFGNVMVFFKGVSRTLILTPLLDGEAVDAGNGWSVSWEASGTGAGSGLDLNTDGTFLNNQASLYVNHSLWQDYGTYEITLSLTLAREDDGEKVSYTATRTLQAVSFPQEMDYAAITESLNYRYLRLTVGSPGSADFTEKLQILFYYGGIAVPVVSYLETLFQVESISDELPPGMKLDQFQFTGTPTEAGVYLPDLKFTSRDDPSQTFVLKNICIQVTEPGAKPVPVLLTAYPEGTGGRSYPAGEQTVQVSTSPVTLTAASCPATITWTPEAADGPAPSAQTLSFQGYVTGYTETEQPVTASTYTIPAYPYNGTEDEQENWTWTYGDGVQAVYVPARAPAPPSGGGDDDDGDDDRGTAAAPGGGNVIGENGIDGWSFRVKAETPADWTLVRDVNLSGTSLNSISNITLAALNQDQSDKLTVALGDKAADVITRREMASLVAQAMGNDPKPGNTAVSADGTGAAAVLFAGDMSAQFNGTPVQTGQTTLSGSTRFHEGIVIGPDLTIRIEWNLTLTEQDAQPQVSEWKDLEAKKLLILQLGVAHDGKNGMETAVSLALPITEGGPAVIRTQGTAGTAVSATMDLTNGEWSITSQNGLSPFLLTLMVGVAEVPFADLEAEEWYYDGVLTAWANGWMTGTAADAFVPGGTVTRAQVWTTLARMAGAELAEGEPWYASARDWAMRAGVSDGTDPEGPVTRAQLAAMLYRFAQRQGLDVSVGEDTNILSYTDAFDLPEWSYAPFQWAAGAGIVSGVPDGDGLALDHSGTATRAQLAVMLTRFQLGGVSAE